MTDRCVNVLDVTPFGRPAVFQPKANSTDVAAQSLSIEAVDNALVACIAPSF